MYIKFAYFRYLVTSFIPLIFFTKNLYSQMNSSNSAFQFQLKVNSVLTTAIGAYQSAAQGFLNTRTTTQAATDSMMDYLNGSGTEKSPLNSLVLSQNYNGFYSRLKAIVNAANIASLQSGNVVALATAATKDAATAGKTLATVAKAVNTALASVAALQANIASYSSLLDTNDQEAPAVADPALDAIKATMSALEQVSLAILKLTDESSGAISITNTVNTAALSNSSDIAAFVKGVTATMGAIKSSSDKADANYVTTYKAAYKSQAASETADIDFTASGYDETFEIPKGATAKQLLPSSLPDYITKMQGILQPAPQPSSTSSQPA